MRLQLANRLRKRLHLETAMLQDEVVSVVYELEGEAVLHGGTAIWRCYGGNRFSEDLDFYLPAGEGFRKKFGETLSRRGLRLAKYRQTGNAVYSRVSDGVVEVRFEALLKNMSRKAVARSYEKADGSFMDVLTLAVEGLLLEKIEAYSNRRLVRDVYDVYFLLRLVEKPGSVRERVRKLVAEAGKPVDGQNLKALVYQGAVPSFDQMMQEIARF